MKRSLATALVLLVAITASGAALAQTWPAQTPSAQTPPAQTSPASAVQCNDFFKLREEAQKKALAVRAANERKAERKEVCTLVQRFASAEESVVKFLVVNKTWCGVPDQAIKDAKAGHDKTLKFRTMACTDAPAAHPKVPTLSDAIATPSVDTAGNTRTGRGTLDTLNGNALTK